jgi:shikimate dehydrogenase
VLSATAARCAVLGRPIAHSLSPAMHRSAYRLLGLDWTYGAVDLGTDELPGFVAALDESWRGLSLTMPLKRAVLPLLDEVTPLVSQVGAANTVVIDRGRLLGDNTDVGGVVEALAGVGCTQVTDAVIVGAGATAESTLVALQSLGLRSLRVLARSAERALPLVQRAESADIAATAVGLLDERDPRPVDLLVSTLPGDAGVTLPEQLLTTSAVVFDVAYDPWPSPLLARAEQLGATTVDGLALLAAQAALQVEAMTGSRVPVEDLRAAALAALGSGG